LGHSSQREVFEDDLPDERIEIDLKRVRLERGRQFGDVWVALRLWQALRLDRLFEVPPGQEDVSWATMAAMLVIARFCEPASELHIAEDWSRRTALGDLLGVPEDKINDDRLYRSMDRVLPHKKAAVVERRVGRLLEENSRAAALVSRRSFAGRERRRLGNLVPTRRELRMGLPSEGCIGAQSTTGRAKNYGGLTSSSPTPRPHFAFTSRTCVWAPCGISCNIAVNAHILICIAPQRSEWRQPGHRVGRGIRV
jgi:hypothetical protein